MPEELRARLRPARRDTTQPSRGGLSTTGGYGLPYDLVERAVHRLGWAGLVYAASHLAVRLVEEYTFRVVEHRPELLTPYYWSPGAGVALGMLVFALARGRKVPGTIMLDLGLLFQVLGGLVISVAETQFPYAPADLVRGHSAISIWVVFFTLIVPASAGKAFLAAFTTAAMGPVGMSINILAGGVPSPTTAQWLLLYVTPFVMAFWAVLLSRYVYNLGAQMGRAREMGSYELVERIGSGGMGEVWRARHRMLVHHAAVKMIRPEALCCDSEEELRRARVRFEREAQVTAALHSPHTVALYDYGVSEDGSFYYVMELLEGLDLERFVKRFGPQPAARVIHMLRQACDSLAEAHAAGLIHRDIKPKNILVCRLGFNYDFIKVLDFGLVKVSGGAERKSLTREGVTTGTPAFMSPEMAMGQHEVDARTDIYAVGCVAYWLLTGQLVFEAGTALGMALEHVQTPPVPPSARTEIEIPEQLERLVLQCLEKDPSRRPRTARDLARALDACPVGEPWTADRAEAWWRMHLPAASMAETAVGAQPGPGDEGTL